MFAGGEAFSYKISSCISVDVHNMRNLFWISFYFILYLYIDVKNFFFFLVLVVLKWCTFQGSYFPRGNFYIHLFYGCCCVSCTLSFHCASSGYAMDRLVAHVRMDIYNFLASIWGVSALSLPMGKDSG